MKTKIEIEEMIELLRLQKIGIPQRSGFGDDNHEAIDRQTTALKKALEIGDDEMEIEEEAYLASDRGNDPAYEAFAWVLGNHDDLVEANDNWVKKGRDKEAAS